jgi:hypothetical protein
MHFSVAILGHPSHLRRETLKMGTLRLESVSGHKDREVTVANSHLYIRTKDKGGELGDI